MAEPTTYVFDFDSTLVRIETLEALADISLAGVPDAAAIRAEVAALTDQAMTGDLPFGEALNRRLALLPLTRDHIAELADRILDEGTPSVRRNLRFFREPAGRLVIPSGGFPEHIAPPPPPPPLPAAQASGHHPPRHPARTVAAGAPPWAPTPGISKGNVGASSRTRATSAG